MRYILMCFFVRFRHMQLEITKKYTLFKLQKRCKDFSRGVWFLTFSPSHIHFGKICLIQNLQFRLCSFQQKKIWLVSKSTRRPKRDRHLFQRLLHRCILDVACRIEVNTEQFYSVPVNENYICLLSYA